MWEVYSAGTNPWKGFHNSEVFHSTVRGETLECEKHWNLHELIKGCFEQNPLKRTTLAKPTSPRLGKI